MTKLKNCIVGQVRSVAQKSKLMSLIGNFHNVALVLFDESNGYTLLQITDSSQPDKVAQKLKNSMLFVSATPVKNFNVEITA